MQETSDGMELALSPTMRPIDLRQRLRRLEAAWIRRGLLATQGDVRAASRLLGLPERTLWRRLETYGLRDLAHQLAKMANGRPA